MTYIADVYFYAGWFIGAFTIFVILVLVAKNHYIDNNIVTKDKSEIIKPKKKSKKKN